MITEGVEERVQYIGEWVVRYSPRSFFSPAYVYCFVGLGQVTYSGQEYQLSAWPWALHEAAKRVWAAGQATAEECSAVELSRIA